MANIKRANASSITKSGVAIADVPDAPTIGAVADTTAGGTVTVAYTAAVTGGTATTFTATSSPGGITGTGSSPINVTGLTDGTAYTFTVTASNATGSATSAASSSVTPTSFLTGAYDSIATTTVGAGGAASITFSSIPSTYQHLQIRGIARSTAASGPRAVYLRLNSDSGSNYASHRLEGNGSSASALALTSQTYIHIYDNPAANQTASVFSSLVLDVLDYANTSKNKTARFLNGFDANGSGYIGFQSGLWMNTTAVTSLTFTLELGDFAQYTQFALYGIKGN